MLSSEGFVCYFDFHSFLVPEVGRHIVDVIQIKSDRKFSNWVRVVYLGLLRIPVVWFSFELTQSTCFVNSRCSSNNIPRHFTVLMGVSLVPLSLYLTLQSSLVFLEWKMINSVFLTFKESLLAFNHRKRLLRSWLLRFC